MMKPRDKRRGIKTVGVAERLADASPSRYTRGASGLRPKKGSDKYLLDGASHRFDGRCHKDCENLT